MLEKISGLRKVLAAKNEKGQMVTESKVQLNYIYPVYPKSFHTQRIILTIIPFYCAA